MREQGTGPVVGRLFDRKQCSFVPLRTPLWVVRRYTHGYTLDLTPESPVVIPRVRYSTDTQYGVFRPGGRHYGEDVFFEPGSPVLSPFDALIEGVYPPIKEDGNGSMIVLRHSEDPRLRVRLAHISPHRALRAGHSVRKGASLAHVVRSALPNGANPHVHVEAIWDAPHRLRGNMHPFEAFDVGLLSPDEVRRRGVGDRSWR